MIKKLYVFANMGHLGQLPKSGGQSSARRVMKGLQGMGIEVVPIRRHRGELEGKWKHKMETLTFAVIDPCKIVAKMLFGRRCEAAFLHLTYAGPLVPYELFLTVLVKLIGYKSLIYLKGGQVMEYYRTGSRLHRWMFRRVMDMQEIVFFEGMESLEMVKSISKTRLVYFPNYVFDEQIPPSCPLRRTDVIDFIYFGRIAPDKHVDVILDTFELLCTYHDNLNLTIIGGVGQSRAYADMINQRITHSVYSSKITRWGITPFEKIKELMQTKHFFLFPSGERAEGHSNSLNEAMSQGLIPIVSDWHFNASVVGNPLLVVKGFEAKDYASRIEDILEKEDLNALSDEMLQRVKSHFSYSAIMPQIVSVLRAL